MAILMKDTSGKEQILPNSKEISEKIAKELISSFTEVGLTDESNSLINISSIVDQLESEINKKLEDLSGEVDLKIDETFLEEKGNLIKSFDLQQDGTGTVTLNIIKVDPITGEESPDNFSFSTFGELSESLTEINNLIKGVSNRIDTLEEKIPSEVSKENPLVTRDSLVEAVTNLSIHKITFNSEGDPFPTAAALKEAEVYYCQGEIHTLDENDYAIVLEDETAPEPFTGGQSKYEYNGRKWVFSNSLTTRSFSPDEKLALSSGITKEIVDKAKDAYELPRTGIPEVDLSYEVRVKLDKYQELGKIEESLNDHIRDFQEHKNSKLSADKLIGAIPESVTFPTLNQDTTGKASRADKLETPRKLRVLLHSDLEAGVDFDGSSDVGIPVTGKLPFNKLSSGSGTGLFRKFLATGIEEVEGPLSLYTLSIQDVVGLVEEFRSKDLEIDKLKKRLNSLEQLGVLVGVKNTIDDLPSNLSEFPEDSVPTINDFVTVRAVTKTQLKEVTGKTEEELGITELPENLGPSSFSIAQISESGEISWFYEFSYSSDMSGKANIPTDEIAEEFRNQQLLVWFNPKTRDLTVNMGIELEEGGEQLVPISFELLSEAVSRAAFSLLDEEGVLKEKHFSEACITDRAISPYSIGEREIKETSLGGNKLKDNSISGRKLQDSSIDYNKLNQALKDLIEKSTLAEDRFLPDTIGIGVLKGDSVTTNNLVNLAVTSDKIANTAVTEKKIADGSVTSRKIEGLSVSTEKIADNAVSTEKIADNAVSTEKIAYNAVITEKIADNAVITEKIADNAVITEKIADNAISTSKVRNSAVTGDKLAPGSVTYDKVKFDVDHTWPINVNGAQKIRLLGELSFTGIGTEIRPVYIKPDGTIVPIKDTLGGLAFKDLPTVDEGEEGAYVLCSDGKNLSLHPKDQFSGGGDGGKNYSTYNETNPSPEGVELSNGTIGWSVSEGGLISPTDFINLVYPEYYYIGPSSSMPAFLEFFTPESNSPLKIKKQIWSECPDGNSDFISTIDLKNSRWKNYLLGTKTTFPLLLPRVRSFTLNIDGKLTEFVDSPEFQLGSLPSVTLRSNADIPILVMLTKN